MDLVGLSRSSRTVVPVRFVRPHRLRSTTVGLEPTTTTVCRALVDNHSLALDARFEMSELKCPFPQKISRTPTGCLANATISVCRTLVPTTTLLLFWREGLLLPATHLLIGRWVVRRLVAASRLAGARVWCSPSAHWLEETLSSPPRSGASTRDNESSAHVLSQKHVRNGDRSSVGRWRCCSGCSSSSCSCWCWW